MWIGFGFTKNTDSRRGGGLLNCTLCFEARALFIKLESFSGRNSVSTSKIETF